MASQVFFMDDRANALAESLPFKAVKVFRDAGLGEIFKPGDTVGVKVHLGEYGNSLNLRPHYIRPIVDEIKRLGGKPVIVECNTLILGAAMCTRAVASDHLRVAARHGFTEETMGCPIWIADGDYGFDDVRVEVPHGVLLTHSYMGKRVQELDALVVVSHFKGHPMGVFGGAIKNVGIGLGSKRGKLCTHLFSHPQFGVASWGINQDVARAMAQGPRPTPLDMLIQSCPFGAMSMNGELKIDLAKCPQCAICAAGMLAGLLQPPPTIFPLWAATIPDACAAYVNAIGKDRVGFVNYAVDITPWCDCFCCHDRALLPNLGVFASKDPVAVDMACLEMAEAASTIPGSKADTPELREPGTERFTHASSMAGISQWVQINTAVYNGLGNSEYELVTSQPGTDLEFRMPPFSPVAPASLVHKEAFARGNWMPDYPFSHPELQLAMSELGGKPKGKMAGEATASQADVKA